MNKKNFKRVTFFSFLILVLITSAGSVFAAGAQEISEKPKEGKYEEYSGFIVLRLSADLPQPKEYADNLEEEAIMLDLNGLIRLITDYGLKETRRIVTSLSPKKLLAMEKKAVQSEFRPLNSLTKYWKIDMRKQEAKIDEVLTQLSALKCVELAYKEHSVTVPVVSPGDDPYNGGQSYQDPAPVGIDARWAWNQPNCEGAGVGFVDMEFGWYLNHEDFAGKSPNLIFGDFNPAGMDHGTAVLGVAVADDNNVGVVGIAPTVSSVSVSSCYESATNSFHVADAITAALTVTNPGDVLLLEIQKNFLPVELEAAILDAIRLVVALGNVVVEAAGNGSSDLDTITNGSGDTVLNRLSPDFIDSGAIMVGAALSALPHNRKAASNYGSRIDCYGWGENIVSCGYGDLDPGTGFNDRYTNTFKNTSGASPIIAGAAMILQGRYKADFGYPMNPLLMRALLSDPAAGTPQGGGVAGNIGVMPDLRAILEDTYEEKTDVFIRDYAGDSGAVPSTGSISASPDIITRLSPVADPQASFGTGSGTENSNTLGNVVESTHDNYIYVRMRNLSSVDANNVTADIYYSLPSTLVTPGMWNLIGTTPPLNVPATGDLMVTQALTWVSGAIPATGHYCYVGILDHPDDPAPPLPGVTDWAGFESLIRDNNNVTWRNFNVVDPPVSGPANEPFFIAGAPDKARIFDLEILHNINPRARILFETELSIGKQLIENQRLKYKIDERNNLIRFYISEFASLYFSKIVIEKAALYKSRFLVIDRKGYVQQGDWIAIRQLYKEQEVGRITWQFEPPKEKKEDLKNRLRAYLEER